MGSERATIEDDEKFFSPMQLNSPAQVAMDAGGGQGEPMSQDQRQQFQQAIRGRGPSLFGDLEQIVDQLGADQENDSDDDSDDNGGRQSSAPLIQEEEAALPQPALDKSRLMQDIWGARDLKEEVGANPYRGVIEAGEILQGGANAARRRGEGRYGAAALHSLGGLAVGAASGEGGFAAGGAAKTALKPLTAAALPLTLAKDAAKYTVGNLISTAGQAVQKVGDSKRDAADPEGILENQRLIDLKNQHEFGYDTTSTEMGRTREQEVAERGVRFEDGDNAKRIWEGPKKRTWGRIAQNAVAAPFRGIGKAFKGLVTSPAAAFKSMINPIAKYGRKFGNWVSNNSWNRKRRANNALERLRARTDPNNANPHPAEAEGALKADSPLGKNRMLNFRGADAAIRSHTRDVRQAQGFDNILGQKDYEKLNQADRVDYRERERALLTSSPKYANMADSFTQDSDQIRSIAQQFDVEPAAAQGPDAEQNLPPLIGGGDGEFENLEEKDAPRLGEPELAKDSHAGASAMEGVDKAVKYGAKIALELPQKAAPAVDAITHVLGKTVPDMLEGQALEDYAPTAEAVTDFGEGYSKYTAGAGLYRAPLIAKGVGTAVDLFRTANQYRNRNEDPNKTALNERRTLEDTREMSNRVRALLKAKEESGASAESIARTKRLRNKMLMHRLVTANRKLAKAQEMNGITPLNEYSKKESDFVRTGEYSKDEEVGAKGPGELAKEFGKNTKKIFGAFVGDTNTADSTSEAERLYPPNRDADDVDDVDDAGADPQLGDASAHQSVMEEIEDEEKHASGELSAGGNSQLGAIGVNQNVIKEEVNRAPGELDPANRVPLDLSSLGHASGELNVVQHPDTNLNSQRQRPSQVDFDVSDDDNDNAVAAGGSRVNIDHSMSQMDDDDFVSEEEKDEPNGLPPWITQIEESEGEEFHSRARFSGGVKRKEPSADGMERVLAGHRGDITVDHQKVEPQYPNKGSDPEKPFGGVWKRADTKQGVQVAGIFGSNPDELYPNGEFHDEPKVEFQGAILEKEKILAAPQAHKPAPAKDQAQRVIEEEEKDAPVNLDTANRVRPVLSSQGMIHAPGESNAIHHSNTNSFSQGQSSHPRQKRPSEWDFNVSDNDDDNDNAVAAGGGGVRVDQPSDAGLDPDLLAQMNQFEGAENSMDGNPLGNSIRRVSDFHDSVRSDGTALERMGSVVDDFQEQPMGGQGPQGPALGNGPMLNHLVDGQWQMMQEEEKGVAVEEEKGAQAHGALPNVNTGSGAVNVASEALLNRMHATKPAVWPNIKPWRYDDSNRESPAYNVSESEAAEYQGLMAGEGMKDVSTRYEGLDLPSARVHVPSDTSDLPEWVSEFSGPGGELDFFDNEDEKFELGKDVIRNVDKYAPNMAKESGPEETINRVFDGYKSNDQERIDVRKKFMKRERDREEGIDIASKKMLEGDPADRVQNRQKLQIPTEDAMTNSGPMTIGGHEVVPEMENKFHDPRKPQGGWWRSAATGQKLGWAGLAGSKPLASPFGIDVAPFGELWQGNVVAGEKKREVRAKAKLDGIGPDALGEQLAEVSEQGRRQGFGGVADEGIVQAPAAGWGNIGKKPGMFAGKKAKEDYKQKTKAIDPVIDDAWGKMKGEAMPSFMKGVPYAEKKWREKERAQRALEEQEALRRKWGMGAENLRGL